MNAWTIYSAAKERKLVVALCLVITTAAAIAASFLLPTFYISSTTLLPSERAIRGSAQTTTENLQATTENATRETKVADLVTLARSRSVVERAQRAIAPRYRALVGPVDSDSVIKPGGVGTDLIRISVKAKSPGAAVAMANACADQFMKFYDEVSHREAVQTRESLEDLAARVKGQLDRAQADLEAFRKEHAISDLPAEVTASLNELSPLRGERDDLEAKLADINARLAVRRVQVATTSPSRLVTGKEPPTALIDALRTSIAQSNSELLKLSQIYTPDYYRIKQLKQQISDAQIQLDKLLKHPDTVVKVVDDPSYGRAVAEVSDLQAESNAGRARLQRLTALVSEREAKLGAYSGVDLQLAAKKRRYDESQQQYTSLLGQVHTAGINERLSTETGAIRLIDSARTADGPVHAAASPGQLIISAMIVGLMLGLGVAVGLDSLDKRIKTPADASDLMELPVAGVIPAIPSPQHRSFAAALVTQNAPMSSFAESYRFLATEVMLEAPAKGIRSIMVATAKPGQGGTSTICNLAITLAQAGKSVALVDADLRRPSLHAIFGVVNDYGLAEVLSDNASAERALKSTSVDNLLLLTGGVNIVNPWALLRSAKMPAVIDELKRIFDYVLVDTPSAIVFADAAIMASVVDGVIVVVRANESPRGSELQIKSLLNHANANILGVVLNDVPSGNVDNCHFHGHYYPMEQLDTPKKAIARRDEEVALSISDSHSSQ